ncbi:MAG: ABC transporter ATP-binding protein [Lachnospiraceae bacterium]|nr:ABC transporter ATP-binding protein [Lachnospiraceae bacterium]
MIKLTNVNKLYKGETYSIKALDDISLSVSEGEFLSVMRRSGSGKTTLLNLLGFLDVLTEGEFMFMGEDVSRLSPRQLWKYRKNHIGFIFQHFALIDHCTVYENVALPLNAGGISKKECKKRACESLEQLGISDLKDKYPGQISGGQKQRVAIARALVGRPKLILADEPTGALDYNTGLELMDIFEQIHKTGKTIIMVTHDKNIAQCTERIITIEDAKLISDCR